VLSHKDGGVKAIMASVGKSPHAAQPNPQHPDRIYVSNIAPQAAGTDGKPDRGETITELVRTAGPQWAITRFLDLKAVPALSDANLYPSRRPVCVGFSKDGRYMLATLFNGGLAVVDLQTWNVAKSWGKNDIAENGCGFAASPSGDELYVTAGNQQASWLYVFDTAGEPQLVATHNLSKLGQDAHGVIVDPASKTLWIAHRVSSNVTIQAAPGKFELKRLYCGKRIAPQCRDLLPYFCSTLYESTMPCGPSSSTFPLTPSQPWIPC
jgi:hypothetical protein